MNKWNYEKDYAVVIVDKNFSIIFLNRKATGEYGKIIGKKCYQVFNNYDMPCDEVSPYVCPIKILQSSNLKRFSCIYVFNRKKEQYVSLTIKKEGEYFIQEHIKLNGGKINIIDTKSVINNLYEGIVITDNNQKIKMINQKFISIFNIHLKEDYFVEKDIKELQRFVPENIRNLFDKKELSEGEEFIIHYKNKYLIIKVSKVNDNHKLWSFVEKEEIDLGDEIFRILLETTPVGIFLQCEGRFMYVNPTLASMLETTPGELIGASIDNYVHLEDKPKLPYLVRSKKRDGKLADRDTIRVVTSTGKIKWVEITLETVSFKERYCSIGSVIDITDRKNLEESLRKLATIDQLTGIYNRYAFEKFLEEEIKRAERYDSNFSIIMFDIDNFKNVNDMYGHQVGDKVLKKIVSIVKENIRKSDIFARWGGEEFMILVPIKNKTDAYNIAEKIRKKIENYKFDNIGKITVSIGISFYKKGDSLKRIIRRADTALYQAKKSGKNMTVVAD